ncbi:MAG TPA: ATP-binding cassette domain-containing protein, partial [Caldimonas sp.]|nr:ATP-binding cassette domain-containing protein [Caldimonas sp.]
MLLEVRNLTKRFGGLTAVSELSFSLEQGDIVGVFGPNGSGKTTLLNLIAGVYVPSSGELLWQGRTINGSKPHEIAEAGIVKTFQNPQLFGELSVFENVAIAGHLSLKRQVGWRRVATLLPRRRRDDALTPQIDHILRLCRLEGVRDETAASLSYGGEKMLGVAMALMCNPKLLLLDEPGSGLGQDEIANLDQVLRDLRDHGTTLCVID